MKRKQQTMAREDFERYRKPTRRERFRQELKQVVPWSRRTALVEPMYPEGEGADRTAVSLLAPERTRITGTGSYRCGQ
jgi:IS5 family transposase